MACFVGSFAGYLSIAAVRLVCFVLNFSFGGSWFQNVYGHTKATPSDIVREESFVWHIWLEAINQKHKVTESDVLGLSFGSFPGDSKGMGKLGEQGLGIRAATCGLKAPSKNLSGAEPS